MTCPHCGGLVNEHGQHMPETIVVEQPAKQRQVHVVTKDNPLARSTLLLLCSCSDVYWRGPVNTRHLAAVLAEARRDHNVMAHGWQPAATEEAPDAAVG